MAGRPKAQIPDQLLDVSVLDSKPLTSAEKVTEFLHLHTPPALPPKRRKFCFKSPLPKPPLMKEIVRNRSNLFSTSVLSLSTSTILDCDTPDRDLLQQTANVAQKRRRLGRAKSALAKCVTNNYSPVDHLYQSIPDTTMGQSKTSNCLDNCIPGCLKRSNSSEPLYEEISEYSRGGTEMTTIVPSVAPPPSETTTMLDDVKRLINSNYNGDNIALGSCNHNSRRRSSIGSYTSSTRPNKRRRSGMSFSDNPFTPRVNQYTDSESDTSSAHSRNKTKMYAEYRGQLNLNMNANSDNQLTVNVLNCKHLFCKHPKLQCNSYVQVTVIPEEMSTKHKVCETKLIYKTNQPAFHEQFIFQLTDTDYNKRVLVSVLSYDKANGSESVLGCMSFGIRNILKNNNPVDGWYYLLKEKTGFAAHMQACEDLGQTRSPSRASRNSRRLSGASVSSNSSRGSSLISPSTKSESCSSSITSDMIETFKQNVPEFIELITIPILRGSSGGYGLTLSNGSPAQVTHVASGSPAERSGLKVGDSIVRVNGQFVHKMYADTVGQIIRHYQLILIDVLRSNQSTEDSDSVAMTTNFHLLQRIADDFASMGETSDEDCLSTAAVGSLV